MKKRVCRHHCELCNLSFETWDRYSVHFQSRGHLVNGKTSTWENPALVPDYKILTTQVHFLPTKIFVLTMKVMMAVVMARPLQIFRAVFQQTKKQMDNQVFTRSHQNFFSFYTVTHIMFQDQR